MFLKKLFSKSRQSALGIDIGSSSVKVVQLSKSKGVVLLDTYGSLALGPYSSTDIGKSVSISANTALDAVLDIIKESDVTTKNIGVSIPFRSSLISLINIPRVPKNKIAQVIPYEARKYIPVSLSDVSLDWFVVPDTIDSPRTTLFENKEDNSNESGIEGRKQKVLLIAVHNHELGKYKKIIEDAGFKAGFFEIEIFSSLRSTVSRNFYPTLVIDIGSQTSKFYIVENGIVYKSYFINKGGQTITNSISKILNIPFNEAERLKREEGLMAEDIQMVKAIRIVLDEILKEGNNAISDFQYRYKKNVGKIIITGGGGVLKGLIDLSKEMLNTDVEIADPFSFIQTPDAIQDILRDSGPEFAVAMGSALRHLEEL